MHVIDAKAFGFSTHPPQGRDPHRYFFVFPAKFLKLGIAYKIGSEIRSKPPSLERVKKDGFLAADLTLGHKLRTSRACLHQAVPVAAAPGKDARLRYRSHNICASDLIFLVSR